MRIVYVTSMLPFGPMEAFLIPEIEELLRRGHDLLVVPMHPRGPVMHADAASLRSVTLAQQLLSPAVLRGALLEAIQKPVQTLATLWQLLASGSLVNVLKNLLAFPKALWLSREARLWGADHIHAQWLSTSATLAYVANAVSGIPWSYTAHRWDIIENNLIRQKSRTATFGRTISEWGAAALKQLVEDPERVIVIHMGVPRGTLTAGVALARQTGPVRVVMAANLLPVKGHVYAIDAVAVLRSRGFAVRLDFAGGGPLRGELEKRVEALGLHDAVRFLGVVSHRELVEGMRSGRWDMGVLASVDLGVGEKEGIPVFLIESLAASLPVVATSTGGIPELLGSGGGIMVPDKDPIALAKAIERLADDAELRAQVAREGVRCVRARFTVEGAIDDLQRLLSTR